MKSVKFPLFDLKSYYNIKNNMNANKISDTRSTSESELRVAYKIHVTLLEEEKLKEEKQAFES